MSITYSKCVFVALVIDHVITSSVTCSAVTYLVTLCHNGSKLGGGVIIIVNIITK